MEIVKIEMNLKAVNKSIALFNCEKRVSGVIHSNSTGETTVILDGGYVLGKFDSPHCAVKAISLLTVKVSDGEQAGHTYACWSLSAGANPNFIATQMGHTDAQMVYKVYGKWMSEKSAEQVSLLNQALSRYAPSLPQSMVAAQ